MKKSTSVLTFDQWKKISLASFSAFPKIWWRVFSINLLALLMIILGTVIVGGLVMSLVGGFAAFESLAANLMVSQYMAPSNWLILALAFFIWINWVIVFGVTAKIASFLVVKDYVKKKTSNPISLYFESSWSFFWRYIGLGFRNFWYIFWPFLGFIVLMLIIAIPLKNTVSHAQEEVVPVPTLISEEVPVDIDHTHDSEMGGVPTEELEMMESEAEMDGESDTYMEKAFDDQSAYGNYNDEPFNGFNMAGIVAFVFMLGFFGVIFGFIIWRSVHVVFSQMRLIEKDSMSKEAFESSLAMVKGNWWLVFGALIGFFGITVMIPGLLFGLSSLGVAYLDMPIWIIDIISNLYSYMVAAPLGVAFIYFLGLHIGKKKKI